jgi:predicted lipid-binding transport protein (Tim44 family)
VENRIAPLCAIEVDALQIIELIIFGLLAVAVLYQLYAVLGRRMGRQPTDAPATSKLRQGFAKLRPEPVVETSAPEGVGELKSRDPSFDASKFLNSARAAYETIVRAFIGGDRTTLRPLVDDVVFDAFEAAIKQREAADRTESMEFLQPVRADLESAAVEGDLARTKVRFLAEFRTRTKDAAGEAVDDRRTAEVWTFERMFSSRDPKWLLTRVDAAEA